MTKRTATIHDQRYRKLITNLVEARKEAKLSQKELANLMGLTQPDMSKIERFERRLDVIEFADILTYIGQKLNKDMESLWLDLYERKRR